MIKANELRIGNIIYDQLCGAYALVLGIENNLVKYSVPLLGKNYDDCPPNEDVLIPIPLTEEILLKCGFNLLYDQYYMNDMIPMFEWLNVGVGFQAFNDSGNKIVLITTLHQLQNLVHSLTGEELNVEL